MATTCIVELTQRPEAMRIAGFDIQALICGDQAQAFEVFLTAGSESTGAAPHSHPWDETFYVLRGSVLFGIGDQEQWIVAGTLVHVAGGERHWYRFGEQEGQFLSITSGKAASGMYRELAALPAEASRSDYRAIASRHGQQAQPS